MTPPPLLSLGELVRARAAGAGGARELLRFVDHSAGDCRIERRSYATLWSNGQALARALLRQGLEPGDRLALMMENHAPFVDAMVASAIVGTVLVPIDPRTRGRKLRYLLDFARCRSALAGSYCRDAIAEVRADVPALEWVWHVDEPSFAQRLEAAGPELPIATRMDTPMLLVFSSGTTGDPKAFVATYERYATKGTELRRQFGIRDDDRMYTGLSLTHGSAQNMSLGISLYHAIPLVFSRKFSKSRLWRIVADFECTTMVLLGGMFAAIYAEPPSPQDRAHRIRLVVSAGLPAALWEAFARRFGVSILEFYAATEGGLTLNPPGVGPVGSIGKPPPTLVARVVDEEDRDCPPMVPGEMIFQRADGSPPTVEYLGNPRASAEKVRGGWLRSGDLGYRDRDGWLYFASRKGYEIRRNGEFLSPGFIQKEIAEHPDVSDVFVYGVPIEGGVAGERDVVAAIVLREGARWDLDAMLAYCAARMEANAVPRYFQLLDEIPKTASEKPLEGVLLGGFDRSAPNVRAR